MHWMQRRRSDVSVTLGSVVLLSTIMLVGCVRVRESVPLPQGEVFVRGVLSPTDLSSVRRGSFLLSQGGRTLYYVESPTVSLHRFVGRELFFTGVVEPNNDQRSLPVFVVREVRGEDISSSHSSSSPLSSSSTSSLSPGGLGIPCGGQGGVLCPEGQYCAVESREKNIGRCRKAY